MVEFLSDPAVWVSFLTLTLLEVVLGVDNIIFLSILVSRLPKQLQARARTLGLAFAMITRIGLLFSLTWLTRLTAPLFTVLGEEISGRDLILLVGGLFLMAKSVSEIHNALEGPAVPGASKVKLRTRVLGVIIQIGIVDIIFSLDSVLTAIGLANH
ncbi:MAG: TerC family protein, partial [Steroidobacteraceae bacterium]